MTGAHSLLCISAWQVNLHTSAPIMLESTYVNFALLIIVQSDYILNNPINYVYGKGICFYETSRKILHSICFPVSKFLLLFKEIKIENLTQL